ncbi:expressed unknown protein [Seminavis robusta]|uniref:Uncharacterized protein n=1 Tax=Seminavis robusta TaxID=568900 RepID=A0A9N8H6B0_9STRA|nr:expressed unknown protein [Seminavis robusta]|eukprot:Sro40_g024670.1 n/a (158) ;mRNA; r:74442-74915
MFPSQHQQRAKTNSISHATHPPNPKKQKCLSGACISREDTCDEESASPFTFSTLLEQKDLWINDILPLVGMGQYAFVGGVNKQMKGLYEKFCSTVKDAPLVRHQNHKKIPATSTDTVHSAAFYNVDCAKYWYSDDPATKRPPITTSAQQLPNMGVFQ